MTESQEQKTPKTEAVCPGISGRRDNSNSWEWWSRLKAQEFVGEVGYGCTRMSSLEVEMQENTASVGGYNAENWWGEPGSSARGSCPPVCYGYRVLCLWLSEWPWLYLKRWHLVSCDFFAFIIIHSKYYKTAGMWRHTPLIPVLGRQRQVDLWVSGYRIWGL